MLHWKKSIFQKAYSSLKQIGSFSDRYESALNMLKKSCKNLSVSIALFQILISSFIASTNQINPSILSCNRTRIKRNFNFHLDRPFFKNLIVHFKNIGKLLIPLEWMDTRWDTRLETIFNIVINAQIIFNKLSEIF